jgi:lipopolysaccharide export system protein LptA
VASLKAQGVVAASTVRDERARLNEPRGEIGTEAVPFRIIARNTARVPEENAIMYTGEVAAFGSDVTIRSESLLLSLEESGAPREMVAMGQVRVLGGGEEIFCNKAVWSPTRQLLVMTGDARIRGAAEWIRGDEITLHLDTGRIAIKGREVQRMEEGEGP